MTDQAPPPADEGPVPFEQDKFKVVLGLDSNDAGEIRLRAAYTQEALQENGAAPDLSDPAVFMAQWLMNNWSSLRNICANEYNVRQSLAMISEGSKLQLVSPQGGLLTQ